MTKLVREAEHQDDTVSLAPLFDFRDAEQFDPCANTIRISLHTGVQPMRDETGAGYPKYDLDGLAK